MDLKSEILKQLEANRGKYLSGGSLSQSLSITRQAVWKAVKKLIEEGYAIDSVTNRGYKLDGKCDLLSSAIISEKTGAKLYCYDEVTSTNSVARKLFNDGGECIVIAERQTTGRTKNGSEFLSPKQKGVYMSVALNCRFSLAQADGLRGMLAERVAKIICDCCGNMPEIRNLDELFLQGKKVCGILIEGEVNLAEKKVFNAVIGIGVYTAEVGETLGYITSAEPRNALVCNLYEVVKEIFKS